MSKKKAILAVLKGIAKVFTLGLLGRGRKTQQAGQIAGETLDNLDKKKEE